MLYQILKEKNGENKKQKKQRFIGFYAFLNILMFMKF